ncbi:MAG TPA: transglutaminase-like domain-containing protein [Syntrophobacteraceae bacterium]|nr:transglutaminase-like domain-containing protein [Syntrophobacteraceae bacterium]
MGEDLREYLEPTSIIDSDHPAVIDYAQRSAGGAKDPVDLAKKLYLAVRDNVRYDPYSPFFLREHYRASYVIGRGRSFCIPKASLLCALGRVCDIPSRVGFATVRNHLATRQLIEFLGSDVFPYHGFVEFYLEGKWVKCTPAFNRELCERHGVVPLDFDGRNDSMFQAYNSENRRFMDYLEFFGVFADIPVSQILDGWRKAYGDEVYGKLRRLAIERDNAGASDFDYEDVWNE